LNLLIKHLTSVRMDHISNWVRAPYVLGRILPIKPVINHAITRQLATPAARIKFAFKCVWFI